MPVDFLIVTALDDEFDEVRVFLKDADETSFDGILGTIPTKNSASGEYRVALIKSEKQGTNAAQTAVYGAFRFLRPRFVILVGIAAGFPEIGAKLGDVLVPDQIFYYELVKEAETPGEDVVYQYRSLPVDVSRSLFRAAQKLARNPEATWVKMIREKRPDGLSAKHITVHCKKKSILGCGEKLVASVFSREREHLVNKLFSEGNTSKETKSTPTKEISKTVIETEYATVESKPLPVDTNSPDKGSTTGLFKIKPSGEPIGLEMESFGVYEACKPEDIPFLVIKACQDPATALKDKVEEKDAWRKYSAQASAAFAVALIDEFDFETMPSLIEKLFRDVENEVVKIFKEDVPDYKFEYSVSLAESYTLLKQGLFKTEHMPITRLIPGAGRPTVILHGGGGAGKTNIVKRLVGMCFDNGLSPVFLDLKSYVGKNKSDLESQNPDELVRNIIVNASIPSLKRLTIEELAEAEELKLVVIVDGLNEIPRAARNALGEYLISLHSENSTCYLLATDRLGSAEDTQVFTHYCVDDLDSNVVENAYDSIFGPGSFEALQTKTRKIFSRPFFLDLAIKHGIKFEGAVLWSKIFEQFFDQRLGLGGENLDKLAETVIGSFSGDRLFDPEKFRGSVDESLLDSLEEAQVLNKDGGFVHDLWRDYLASRHLTRTEADWRYDVFDNVTTFLSSPEVLFMTLEQLGGRIEIDPFLKAVFDWSYVAAAECIAHLEEADPKGELLSHNIRAAILAGIAEKRFDQFKHSADRAEEILKRFSSDFAQEFKSVSDRDQLSEFVAKQKGDEEWFTIWQTLFCKLSDSEMNDQEIDLISSSDPIIGWAAANAVRRATPDSADSKAISLYEAHPGDEGKTIRWRVVHMLGKYPSMENVTFLLGVLKIDEQTWVKYGSVRALMEIASIDNNLRDPIFSSLQDLVSTTSPHHIVLREIVRGAFISSASEGWSKAAKAFVEVLKNSVDYRSKKIIDEELTSLRN
jgi:nucleoside phosphorylase